MNVYEQVKNMSIDEFGKFCAYLYNVGYLDMSHGDDEPWIISEYAKQDNLRPWVDDDSMDIDDRYPTDDDGRIFDND